MFYVLWCWGGGLCLLSMLECGSIQVFSVFECSDGMILGYGFWMVRWSCFMLESEAGYENHRLRDCKLIVYS